MLSFAAYQKRLIKMALITSPLIGLFALVPMVLISEVLPHDQHLAIFDNIPHLLLGIGLVTGIVLTLWGMNIFLLCQFNRMGQRISQKTWLRYILSYMLAFILIASMMSIIENLRPYNYSISRYQPFFGSFVNNTFILILINLIVTQNERAQLKLEKAQLEISHLLMQHEQLKQQIHPHFLFNALSTLQILMRKDVRRAYKYAGQLATYLRSSLTLSRQDVISVAEDLAFMERYIQLQQIRFADLIHYDIQMPEHLMAQGKLPVFSLQTLAENAIKHNAFSANTPLQLEIRSEQNQKIVVSNNRCPKLRIEESTRIGLKNLRDRFRHFTKELPQVEESTSTFTVTLKVL